MPAAELELRRLKVRLREREERYAGKSFLSRAEKWFPIAYILLGVIYAYYSYVVVFSYWKVALHDGNVMVSIGLLVPAHIILLLFVISYYRAVTSDPGYVSTEWSKESCKEMCFKCTPPRNRPDRAKHCRECNSCVLRFDHHCPFINNCVGFKTQKFFLLTLFYMVVLLSYGVGSIFVYLGFFPLRENYKEHWMELQIVVCVAVGIMFWILLLLFLVYEVYLLMRNLVALDVKLKTFSQRENPYNITVMQNASEILGKSVWSWFVPVQCSMEYPYQPKPHDN